MNNLGKYYIFISTAITLLIVLIIIGTLFIKSYDAISTFGLDIFTDVWNPDKGKFGILPMLYGSFIVTTISLLIAVPVGLFCALYLSEVLKPKYRLVLKSFLELLAGIPSVIFGLLGIAFVSPWIANIFHLESGRTLLTGSLVLSMMILPMIVTLSDDTFNNISNDYRDASKALGLYPSEVIFNVILPIAYPNILQVILLALGRAVGETMAIMLLIGNKDKIPAIITNILVSGQTITSKIGREISETPFGSLHFSALIFIGLILLLIVLFLVFATTFFPKN
jgi:phosphate transport system permease protein